MLEYLQLIPAAAAITTLGGAYLTIKKIARDSKKEHKERAAEILQAAKEADSLLRAKLEAKIHDLELELTNQKTSIEKDLSHLKDTYNSEIKFLGQKIESLREEVASHHSQLVVLLTKMIDKK